MTAVRIRDVAPRLAFQAASGTTAQKVELVDRLTAAGVKAVEVSSFVRPDLVPGLADAGEVFARVMRPAEVSLECCVGGRGGLLRAADAGAHLAWFLLSADEAFSVANTGRSLQESLTVLAALRERAEDLGIRLGTYVIAAWGGPTGLARRPLDLEPLLRRLMSIGVTDWVLADSFGYAGPRQIRELATSAAALNRSGSIVVQVHDSRGMGVADVLALADVGFGGLDTALAGSGGHPAAPEAVVGGVCTEDAVQALGLAGHDTGLDLDALIAAADWLAGVLGGARGFVRQTGPVPRTGRLGRTPAFAWKGSAR